MPVNDYECSQCGSTCELLCKSGARVECSNCGCEMNRKISAAAIQFKGGGWTENPNRIAREDKEILSKAKKELQNETEII